MVNMQMYLDEFVDPQVCLAVDEGPHCPTDLIRNTYLDLCNFLKFLLVDGSHR